MDGSELQPVSSGKIGLSSEENQTGSLKATVKILAFSLRVMGSQAESQVAKLQHRCTSLK